MLQFKRTHTGAQLPSRTHADDTGLDLMVAALVKQISKTVYLYDTGIAVQPPEGFYTEVIARSSTSKLGISLANGTGVIDSCYRGSIKLAIRFHEDHTLSPEQLVGSRVAQLIVRKLHLPEIKEVTTLIDTVRGEGGFGSTGT